MGDQKMSNEIAIVARNETMEQQQTSLTLAQVKDQVQRIQQIMTEVMKDGEHYGVVPGCGTKKVLLKPGAEKLGLVFRLCPKFTLYEENLPNGHYSVRVTTELRHISNGQIYGEGEGSCTTMETKFRYRNSNRKCPNCGKETIIPGKKEYGGGWLCFKSKGGCGTKWGAGAPEIENQKTGKIEYENPYDYRNTVLKMAIKRSHIAAMIYATAAGDIFTQDLEDMTDIEGVPHVNENSAAESNGKDYTPEPTTYSNGNTTQAKSTTTQTAGAGGLITESQKNMLLGLAIKKTIERDMLVHLINESKLLSREIKNIDDLQVSEASIVINNIKKILP
jgi:hypothetical protein